MSGLSIGELVGTISLQDQFSGPIDKVAKALGVSSQSFQAITGAAGLAAAAIVSATGAIVALGIRGTAVENTRSSFDALSRSVGETGAAMLDASRGATKGLIDDMDLMAAANKAMLLGLPVTAESMGTMAQAATVLGRAMGQDAKKSLDDLTTALGRSSPLILDNLGLTVQVGAANEAYARTLGKSASELTDAEKKTAFYNAAMTAAQAKVAELGGIHLTFADRVQQGRVMVANFVDSLSLAVATSPVVAAGLDSIMTSIEGAFGGNQQQTVQALMGYVNRFAIGIVQAAEVGVEAARFISNAWDGVKAVFNAVVGFQIEILGRLVSSFGSLTEAATYIPGVGDKFAGLADKIKGAGADLQHLASGFQAQATAAVDSAADTNLAFDAVKRTLEQTEERMRSALGAQVAMASVGPAAAVALNQVGEGARVTAEQIKAYEDAMLAAITAQDNMTANGIAQMQTLQDQITMLQTTGIEQRLAELQQAQTAELALLTQKYDVTSAMYQQLADTIREKYGLMTQAAVEAHVQQMQSAAQGADGQIAAAERALAAQKANLAQLVASEKATQEQILRARQAVAAQEMALEEMKKQHSIQVLTDIASAASTILRSVFGKNKAAALAAALIDAAAAFVKALSSAPPPLNFIQAAAVAAAAAAQIAKIRSADIGFATGTPGTSFVDFGAGSVEMLHGREAVINQAQGATLGEVLSGMVRDALNTQSGAIVSELRELRDDLDYRDRLLPDRLRDAGLLARA